MDKKKQKKNRFLKYVRPIALVLLLFALFKGVMILVLLIGLSLSLSYFLNAFKLRNIGIELVTFVAVLSAMKFGPWISLMATFVLITYHMVAGGFFGNYIIWVIPGYCIAAVISGFFPHLDIVTIGTFATLGINANNVLWTGLTSPGFLPKYMIYVITNVMFNIFLFTIFGRVVLLLMI
ncbi:hypothetical protein JXC34_04215 [Candidatus Woesearchaeota archaeon]|nr:hypothetical protein [Candidatus Woesearchaeota archaeon]